MLGGSVPYNQPFKFNDGAWDAARVAALKVGVEVRDVLTAAQVSQVTVEALTRNPESPVRLSQLTVEALTTGTPSLRLAQLTVEVLQSLDLQPTAPSTN